MNQYDVYVKQGRVLALDQDSGDIYRVMVQKNSKMLRVFSSETESNYELYEEDDVMYLLNLTTATKLVATLIPYEEQG